MATALPNQSNVAALLAVIFSTSGHPPPLRRKTYAAPAPGAASSSDGSPTTAKSPLIATDVANWLGGSWLVASSFAS
jgi:hypothetical protein